MFKLQPVKQEINIQGFNSIYYFEFGKNFSHLPEQHDFWEMVYVDKGRIQSIANGMGCILEQGQAIFHEPMEIHAHVSDKRVANNMLVVSFTTDSPAMEYFKGKTFTLDKTGKTLLSLFLQEAKTALGKVPGDYTSSEDLQVLPSVFGGIQMLQCYFTEFLIRLVRGSGLLDEKMPSGTESREIANNSMGELISNFLKDSVYDNLTLKELCSHFMTGKTQLCKIFRDSIGFSPMEYYKMQKMEEAKKLLREKEHSVTEISDMLGYSSVHIFSRAFKESVGFSPRDYVKSIL